MYFSASSEQAMLRDAARTYLSDRAPLSRVRELMETAEGFDPSMWKEMAEMGWQSLAVPEAYGGAGFGYRELGVLLEEMGRSLAPVPFFSSVVLGANAVLMAGTEEQRRRYLPAIAAGEKRITVTLLEPSRNGTQAELPIAATDDDAGGVRLSGSTSYVLDGHTADLLIVVARDGDGSAGLYVVDPETGGAVIEAVETLDMTRKQASVTLRDVAAVERLGERGEGAGPLSRLFDVAAVMLSFEAVGGAQRCMEMSVDYAKQRMQFGRPIGSFQAIKHKCADMLVEVEAARSTALYAGWALDNGDADLGVAAALAKVRSSDAFFNVAAETIQVHGGIGFTWEHDAHLYFKRAKTDQLLFGGPARWRAILADRLGL